MKNGNHTRTQQREEAFDLFCTGLPLREIQRTLADGHDHDAPSLSTLKRWSTRGDWVARRSQILDARQEHQDQARILYGMDYIAELTRIRRKLLTDAARQNTHAAAQAVYALVALEKLIHQLACRERGTRSRKQYQPDYVDILEELVNPRSRPDPPPPLDWSALIDEALRLESPHDDPALEPE